jgi:hypothetical protein
VVLHHVATLLGRGQLYNDNDRGAASSPPAPRPAKPRPTFAPSPFGGGLGRGIVGGPIPFEGATAFGQEQTFTLTRAVFFHWGEGALPIEDSRHHQEQRQHKHQSGNRINHANEVLHAPSQVVFLPRHFTAPEGASGGSTRCFSAKPIYPSSSGQAIRPISFGRRFSRFPSCSPLSRGRKVSTPFMKLAATPLCGLPPFGMVVPLAHT